MNTSALSVSTLRFHAEETNDRENLWRYHDQAIQAMDEVLYVLPTGQSPSLLSVPQQSLGLSEEPLSIACWQLVRRSARILSCTLAAVGSLESGSVDLEDGRSLCKREEDRGQKGGAFLVHWCL